MNAITNVGTLTFNTTIGDATRQSDEHTRQQGTPIIALMGHNRMHHTGAVCYMFRRPKVQLRSDVAGLPALAYGIPVMYMDGQFRRITGHQKCIIKNWNEKITLVPATEMELEQLK